MRTTNRRSAVVTFFFAEDVMEILGVAQTKAYAIILELRNELKKAGYTMPPAGRIQKSYFCKRFGLELADVESALERSRQQAS
jgi:hypothetical protein